MRKMYYVDMHCHPSIKPYSWYVGDRDNPWEYRNKKNSLWYDDPPQETDKALNRHIGLTKFTQSDFRTLIKGDVKIISACLSPIERGLFVPRWWLPRSLGLCLLKFSLELNEEYICQVRRADRNYFAELTTEHNYFLSQERTQRNTVFPTQFELIRNFREIVPRLRRVDTDILYVFFTIEGCHVFNNGGLRDQFNKNDVSDHVREVKGWNPPPLYASIAHHVNNDLCEHAKSLPCPLNIIINQKYVGNEVFTDMGKFVLNELLRTDNGRRIYIDIKHMSAHSREEYYNMLNRDYPDDHIPVLASHGAVNGLSIDNQEVQDYYNVNENIYQNNLHFNKEPINFFDEEIIRMADTKGFLGIQLDERRLCCKEQRRSNREIRERGDQLYHQAGLVWKQIKYIAELLDRKDKFGWGTATIGSDYDGAVNPPNGYWTSGDFGILEENLILHALEYFTHHLDRLKYPLNQLRGFDNAEKKAREVIDLFMRRNAQRFLEDFL